MNIFQSKTGNVGTFNQKIALCDLRHADPVSVVGLYFSESLLFLGILLILLNNLNIIAPGSYFGAYNWVTVVVFFIGLCINFILIPFLYFSSWKDFIAENYFWDKETFWILPLFFFGTFFLYNSRIHFALALLLLSIAIIAFVHGRAIFRAMEFNVKNQAGMLASRDQYVMTLKYLSAYYVLLFIALIFFDPLMHFFVWVRLNF